LLQRPETERVRNATDPEPCQCRPTMSNCAGCAAASVRSPCSGTSRIVSEASPNAVAGPARNAMTAASAIFTAFLGCLRRLSASRPLIESLRVEARRFAGAFAPRSDLGVRLTGRRNNTARPRDPLRRGGQPRHAELPLPSAEAGAEAELRRGGDRAEHTGR